MFEFSTRSSHFQAQLLFHSLLKNQVFGTNFFIELDSPYFNKPLVFKMDLRLFKHPIDVAAFPPHTLPPPLVKCPYPPQTLQALVSSLLTLTIGYCGFKLSRVVSFLTRRRFRRKPALPPRPNAQSQNGHAQAPKGRPTTEVQRVNGEPVVVQVTSLPEQNGHARQPPILSTDESSSSRLQAEQNGHAKQPQISVGESSNTKVQEEPVTQIENGHAISTMAEPIAEATSTTSPSTPTMQTAEPATSTLTPMIPPSTPKMESKTPTKESQNGHAITTMGQAPPSPPATPQISNSHPIEYITSPSTSTILHPQKPSSQATNPLLKSPTTPPPAPLGAPISLPFTPPLTPPQPPTPSTSSSKQLRTQYFSRFNALIYEMKTIIDLGSTPEIRAAYSDGFNVKKHILFCFRHIERLEKDGFFPGLGELGSRRALRLIDFTSGEGGRGEVVDLDMVVEGEEEVKKARKEKGKGKGKLAAVREEAEEEEGSEE